MLAQEVQELLNQQKVKLPSKHVVSKYRLCFDVAYMLVVRGRVAAALRAMRKFNPDRTDGEWLREGRFVGHLTDSSDLWGGTYLVTETVSLPASQVWSVWEAVETLVNSKEEATMDLSKVQQSLRLLSSVFHKHRNVPVRLGARALGLLHKVQALFHSLTLELGGSIEDLVAHLKSVMWICTDRGTEGGLAQLPMLNLRELLYATARPLQIESEVGLVTSCVVGAA